MKFIVVIASLFTWIDFSFIDETSTTDFEHRVEMSIRRSDKETYIFKFVVANLRVARKEIKQDKEDEKLPLIAR